MNRLIRTALVLQLAWPCGALAHDGYDKALQAYSCVDYPKAINLFKSFADQGHGLSQYMMGIMTEQGQGAEIDVSSAFNWYMRAARQDVPDAYFALGDMYQRGISVAKDAVQAYAWFDLADRGGHKLARDMMASIGAGLKPDDIAQAKQQVSDWLKNLKK